MFGCGRSAAPRLCCRSTKLAPCSVRNPSTHGGTTCRPVRPAPLELECADNQRRQPNRDVDPVDHHTKAGTSLWLPAAHPHTEQTRPKSDQPQHNPHHGASRRATQSSHDIGIRSSFLVVIVASTVPRGYSFLRTPHRNPGTTSARKWGRCVLCELAYTMPGLRHTVRKNQKARGPCGLIFRVLGPSPLPGPRGYGWAELWMKRHE